MEPSELLATRRAGHRHQRVDRPRGPDNAQDAFATRRAKLLADLLFDVAEQMLRLGTRWRITQQEPFAQARGAELCAFHPERFRVLDEQQFDATAADIQQQIWPAVETQSVLRGGENQFRLVLTG